MLKLIEYLREVERNADNRTKAVIELMRTRPQGEHGINPHAELTAERRRKVDLWMWLAARATGASRRAFVTEALAAANGHWLASPV